PPLAAVVAARGGRALRAHQRRVGREVDQDTDLLGLQVQLHVAHRPRSGQVQDPGVQVAVAHPIDATPSLPRPPRRSRSSRSKPIFSPRLCMNRASALPTRNPEDPYYVDHRSYVRHHRESRPAKPEEVIDRVLRGAGLASVASVLPDDGQSVAGLNRTLTEMLVECDLMRDERRFLNPWLETFAARCEGWSRSLRSHAHDLGAEP